MERCQPPPTTPTFINPLENGPISHVLCSKSYYIRFRKYMSFPFVYDPLCVPLRVPLLCHLSLCLSAVIFTICLIIRVHLEILLWQGKSCRFYISITAVLVKLLQMIWCYVTNFAMCQSVWLFIRIFKRYTFYIMVLSHIRQRLILEVGIGVLVILGG